MKPEGRILTVDIEAMGLLDSIRLGHPEDIHIIHCKDYETGELFTFYDDFDSRQNPVWLDDLEDGYKQGSIADGCDWMSNCDILIMHNVAGFDALAMELAFPDRFKRDHFGKSNRGEFPFKTCDTLTMSYLLNPERKVPPQAYTMGLGNIGPHGIAAYGVLFGRFKPDHEDWSHLSKEMVHRVEEDVEIGELVFDYLMKEWKEQSARPNKNTGKDIAVAYLCELRMAFAMAYQERRGFAIDVGHIARILPELDSQIIGTEEGFRPHMPMRLKMKKIPESQVDKNAVQISEVGQNPGGYENYMLNGDCRASYAATAWDIVTKKGEYKKLLTKYIPEARGFMQDHAKPPVAGPITPLVWEEIPLGNRDAVKQILFKYGWKGVNYNDTELEYIEETGDIPKPWAGKIDDDSIEAWEESGVEVPAWCKGIADWYVLQSRRGQLLNAKDQAVYDETGAWPRQASKKNECRGLLPKARCFDDGENYGKTAQWYYESNGSWPTTGHWRVPAVAFSCATNTFRMRHRVVVNIPSRGLYGKEMREAFIVGPGKKLLGCDGAGLELRMLAHFMNNALYTSTVLHGDIHTFNQEMAGLATRDMAKKFIYMFLYGSGIPNLARQIGMNESQMGQCVAKFKESLPDLDNLLDRVQSAGQNFGYLLAVDGRWGRLRVKNGKLALNTALNVLLQMTGSLVMKWAHVRAEDELVRIGYMESVSDMPIVAHVHDEGQFEIDTDQVTTMQYEILKDDWKEEEKKQYIDDRGIWSAPTKVDRPANDEGCIVVQRCFHIVGDQYCKALTWAGEELGLRCPTAGEYSIGDSWNETH